MQIFVTDYDTKIAAQNLCDVHLNKQILESAQMLSTYICWKFSIWCSYTSKTNIESDHIKIDIDKKELYKNKTGLCLPTHINHPCNVWLRKDIKNVYWLYKHFIYLLNEYNYRTNKNHGCSKYALSFRMYLVDSFLNFSLPRPNNFCLCMPDEFKCALPHPTEMKLVTDIVQSYRNYYVFKYNSNPRLRKYANREMPKWLKDNMKGELK